MHVDTILITALIMVVILGLIAACVVLSGLIIMLLWNWLAPIFWSSAPVLSLVQGIGVSVAMSILSSYIRPKALPQ